jgi:hypothetical protein
MARRPAGPAVSTAEPEGSVSLISRSGVEAVANEGQPHRGPAQGPLGDFKAARSGDEGEAVRYIGQVVWSHDYGWDA